MISRPGPLGELSPCHCPYLRVILNISDRESIMVYRTTGASVLAWMMRAERAKRVEPDPDLSWLLHGPTDLEVVERDDEPARRLAAE